MKAKRTHNVVATVGTYKDRDGNEKKRYQTCGTALTGEDGRISIKLDAVPVGPDWSGWFSLYEIEQSDAPRVDSVSTVRCGDSDGDSDIAF